MKNFFKLTTLVGVMVFLVATISPAKDIHVPGDYAKIQDALNAADIGDRILVAAGIYEENITIIGRVELIGAGADVTTIRASTGTVVTITNASPLTKVSGFTIDGVDKSGGSGIYSDSPSMVSDVTIINTGGDGISCCYSATNFTISNVTITNAGGRGIYCYTSSTTVSNVTITNTGGVGFYCDFWSSPTISNVTITHARDNGIYCWEGSSPKIRGCVISQNFLNGISNARGSPDIGTEADPGRNSIFGNGNFDVRNDSGWVIKAELNWWGESPPNPIFFWGAVDYDPWLTKPITMEPNIIVVPDALDFGNVAIGGFIERILTVTNQGWEDLEVTDIFCDDSRVTASPNSFTLAMWESQEVRVRFTPTDESALSATLTIESNDPDEGTLEIPVTGWGVTYANRALSLDGSGDYVLIGDPIPTSLQIQNEITLEAWIYVTNYPSECGFIAGSLNENFVGATIFLDGRTNPEGIPSPAGHIHLQIGDGSWHATYVNAQVPLNQWVHISATRKANESAKVYYNGVDAS